MWHFGFITDPVPTSPPTSATRRPTSVTARPPPHAASSDLDDVFSRLWMYLCGWKGCCSGKKTWRVSLDVKFRSGDQRQTAYQTGLCSSCVKQRSCQLFTDSGLSTAYANWRNVRREVCTLEYELESVTKGMTSYFLASYDIFWFSSSFS